MKYLKGIYENNSLKFERYIMEYFYDIQDIIDECDDIRFYIQVEYNEYEKISSAIITINYTRLSEGFLTDEKKLMCDKYFKNISKVFNEYSNIIENINLDPNIRVSHLSHRGESITISISEV